MMANTLHSTAIQPSAGIKLSLDGWMRQGPPPENFTVSRKRDGSVASMYGDDVWDFSAYHPQGRTARIKLTAWAPPEADRDSYRAITGDIRWLLFVVMALRHGPSLSVATLRTYLRLFRAMGRFALGHEQSVIGVLGNVAFMRAFIAEASGPDVVVTRSLLKMLNEMGEVAIGFKPVGSHILSMLETLADSHRGKQRQHPPIPTRIYTQIIAGLAGALTSFETVVVRYAALVEACHASPTLGRNPVTQQKWQRKNAGTGGPQERFVDLLSGFRLADYFTEWDLVQTVQGIGKGLTDVQLVCKLQIQLFSGMRSGEATTLAYSCLAERRVNGSKGFEIRGRTTKLNHGMAKAAKWVTSEDGARAIKCAQSIARIIYALNGVSASELDAKAPLCQTSCRL